MRRRSPTASRFPVRPHHERAIELAGDTQGRQIRKTVYDDRDDGLGTELSDTVFLYNDWNLIAEVDANNANTPIRTYVWGNDLSGSLQGAGLPAPRASRQAGGVGGLLKVVHWTSRTTSTHHCVGYDGNGNVLGLVNATDGTVTARYAYGPFAEPLRASGPQAANPFRFSTKYCDAELGLYYYGYRYYDRRTGRWLSRDSIGERGGRNLCGLVRNNPINLFDYLGLAEKKCTEAIGKNGQPRIIFDPAPPKGGWKVSIAFEKDGSAQARAIDRIEAKWEASVAVLCKCGGCYEIRHGTRVHEDDEQGLWLIYDPTGLPTSPFPVTTTLGGIVGGIIADAILEGISGGVFIPANQSEADGIMQALRNLYGRRPTKPTDGSWKDGKSPCN